MEDEILAAMMDFADPEQPASRIPGMPQGMASPLPPSPLPGAPAMSSTSHTSPMVGRVTPAQLVQAEQHYKQMAHMLSRGIPDKNREFQQLAASFKASYVPGLADADKSRVLMQFKEGLRRIYGPQQYEYVKQQLGQQQQAAAAGAARQSAAQQAQQAAAQQAAAQQAQQQALLQQQQQRQAAVAAQQQQQQQQRQAAAAQQQAQQQAFLQQQQQRQAAAQQAAAAAQMQPAARAASPYQSAGGIVAGQPAPAAVQAHGNAATLQQQQILAQQHMLAQQHILAQQQAAATAKKRPAGADTAAVGAIGAALGGGGAASGAAGGGDGPAAKRPKTAPAPAATPPKPKKESDDVGVTVDNLIDYDQETNQLMEGLQRSRQDNQLRQRATSNQQFLSEWRIGNEFYRQIQRTGGGLTVKADAFELVQLAFQSHMTQVISRALRNAQHRQDASRRSGDATVTSDPRRGVTQIERREKVKADAKAEAERAELLRIAGSKKADEETKERAQKAKAELVGKQQASLANAAVAATLGGKAKGKLNKWDKWSSAAAAGPAAAADDGGAAGAKGKKGGAGGKKGAGKKGAGAADSGGGGSVTEGDGGSAAGSDADKSKAPATAPARGRGLTGTGGASGGSDDASTVHMRDVMAVLERDPMYCRSPMLYRLMNAPRAPPSAATAQ